MSEINEAKKAIEFAREAEGLQKELSMAEKNEAASKFNDLINDTLLKYSKEVEDESHHGIDDFVLYLIDRKYDGSKLSIIISWSSDKETFDKSIDIQEIGPDGYDGKRCVYSMDSNDEVIRNFQEDASQTRRRLAGVSEEDKYEYEHVTDARALLYMIFDHNNRKKNEELERSMGTNRMPVGPEEIDSIAKIIDGSEVEVDI